VDRRRIGGGLLVAAGIVAPWVGQMMGLKVGTATGIIILGLCLLAVIVGLAMLFWPSPKTTSQPRADNRRQSTTARARGGGRISLEDSYSTADTFADVEEGASVTGKRVVHDPARTARRGATRSPDADDGNA
jgi:membrane protein implicated in regulation of membrane protease activity